MKKFNLLFIMVFVSCAVFGQGWIVYDGDVLPHEYEPDFDSSSITSADFSWEVVDDADNADNKLLEFISIEPGAAMFRHRFEDNNPPDAITIVMRARRISDLATVERVCEIDIQLALRDQLRIENDEITLQRSGAGIKDVDLPGWNPDDWNTYRITLDGITGEVKVYLNEDDFPIISTVTTAGGNDFFRVGDGASGNAYASMIDFIAWDTTGTYSPESSPLPSYLQGGDWNTFHANQLPADFGFGTSNATLAVGAAGVAGDIVEAEQSRDTVNGRIAYRMAIADETHTSFYWRMNNIGNTGDVFSIVVRAKGIADHDRVLDLDMDNGEFRERFVVNADGTARLWYSTDGVLSDAFPLPSGTNVYDWNTYRIKKSGDQVALYINEDPDPVVTSTTDEPSGTDDHFRIGDGDSGLTTGFYLDWLTYNVTNAEAPANVDPPAVHITFVTDDNYDDKQVDFLRAQGYEVDKFWPGMALSTVGQDTIDILNASDLVILGRSVNSGAWQEAADKAAWNALTVPILSNNQFGSRSSRINWFNSTTAFHSNAGPNPFNAFVELPDDPIFSKVNLTEEDSIDMYIPPHSFLTLGEGSNAELVATHDSIVVIARFAPDVEFYVGAGESAAGPRTYFGFGNDNTDDEDGNDIINYFPLTENGKAVYLAEIQRMLGLPIRLPREPKGNIIFVHNAENIDTSNDGTEPRDQPFIDELRGKGYVVKERYESDLFVLTESQLAEYNEADVVIIGRSGASGDYGGNNRQAWNRLTSPVMVMHPFATRPAQLDWFNSTNVTGDGLGFPLDSVVQAHVENAADIAFEGITVPVDGNIDWFNGRYRALYVAEEAITSSNGDILVVIENNPPGAPVDKAMLMARFNAGEAFYVGTESKGGGPRSYFGVGHDDTTYYNLSANAAKVWLAEVANLATMEYTPTDLPSANSGLASLSVNGVPVEGFTTLTESYVLEIESGTTPEVTAVAIDGGAVLTIGEFTDNEVVVEVVAADGISTMSYTLNFETGEATGPRILFVGRDAGGDGDGSDDDLLMDKMKEWGYSITYVEGENYNESVSHDGIDLVYISETINSPDAGGFKLNGYPTPLFLAEPYGIRDTGLDIGDVTLLTRTENVTVTEILNDNHPITKDVWEIGEDITVVGTLPSWTFYQYEVPLKSELMATNLGKGEGMTGPSWIAIEPSGVLNERAVILGFHEGIVAGGTEDYFTMVQRSILWLLDSLDAGAEPTSADLQTNVLVYPNPTSELVSVEYVLDKEGSVLISLIDINGRLVRTVDSGFKKAGKNSSKFEVFGLTKGLYFLKVQGSDISVTRKIFINQ